MMAPGNFRNSFGDDESPAAVSISPPSICAVYVLYI